MIEKDTDDLRSRFESVTSAINEESRVRRQILKELSEQLALSAVVDYILSSEGELFRSRSKVLFHNRYKSFTSYDSKRQRLTLLSSEVGIDFERYSDEKEASVTHGINATPTIVSTVGQNYGRTSTIFSMALLYLDQTSEEPSLSIFSLFHDATEDISDLKKVSPEDALKKALLLLHS